MVGFARPVASVGDPVQGGTAMPRPPDAPRATLGASRDGVKPRVGRRWGPP
jgi:hypothetical protein